MPKEVIYSPEALRARDETVPFYPVEHVAIGWAPDCDVQIGIVPGPGATITITEAGGSLTTANTVGPHGGLWMDLDRAGINRLIRSLRKARDAAYGADA